MEIERSSGQTAISKHSESQNSGIRKQLVILAEARQAAVSPETLRVYSMGLAQYHEQDVKTAVRKLSLRKRRDGETAFPDLATMNEEIANAQADRETEDRNTLYQRQEKERWEDYKAHPEKYITLGEALDELKKKRAMENA